MSRDDTCRKSCKKCSLLTFSCSVFLILQLWSILSYQYYDLYLHNLFCPYVIWYYKSACRMHIVLYIKKEASWLIACISKHFSFLNYKLFSCSTKYPCGITIRLFQKPVEVCLVNNMCSSQNFWTLKERLLEGTVWRDSLNIFTTWLKYIGYNMKIQYWHFQLRPDWI